MRILLAGATGAIGRPLVRRLRANQHEVFALARSPDSAPGSKEMGVEAVIADALDAAAVKAAHPPRISANPGRCDTRPKTVATYPHTSEAA